MAAGSAAGICVAAQAEVVPLTDGFIGVYEPTNTYVPTGEIGPEFFSFQFFFTDPDHSFEVTLQAPDDLVGYLEYAVTSGLDVAGEYILGSSLTKGQSATFEMGNILGTTPEAQISQALTLRALGVTTPYVIGISDDPIITGITNPVPEPSTWVMLLAGLGLVGFVANKRKVASIGV